MTNKLSVILIVLLYSFCIHQIAWAQEIPKHDMLYKKDGDGVGCMIQEVLDDRMKYKLADNPDGPVYNILKSDVLLAIKSDGSFLVPANPASQWVQACSQDFHKIITTESQVIPAKFVDSSGDQVKFQEATADKENILGKKEVLAIAYKTGEISLLAPPKEAAAGLGKVASFNTFSSKAVRDQLKLDKVDYEYFTQLALDKADKLGFYLSELCNKKADDFDKKASEENAIKLFKHDSTWVTVSSLNKEEHQRYRIREYLRRIRMLAYDQVELQWRNIDYITKLRLGPDGNYYGIITIQQLFRGFIDGKVQYQDVTQKDIEVMLTTYKVEKNGKEELIWDVFLSDIGVQQTKEK